MCRCDTEEDDEAKQSLMDGFVVNEKFRDYSVDDLCVRQFRVALKENRKATGI